ncbi:MAG TPA: hypothetical protein VEZ11_15855 [Thermoanaerobaculia bacterium]|nr:hypothetical protein [Thermoanaerobaculia bacterium]
MPDRHFEILELPDDVRNLIAGCEITGQRSIFEREGRAAAILLSFDEYLALRETLEISNDAALRARLATAEAEVARGAMLLPEDLRVE